MEKPFSTHTSHKIKSEITFAICSTTPDQAGTKVFLKPK